MRTLSRTLAILATLLALPAAALGQAADDLDINATPEGAEESVEDDFGSAPENWFSIFAIVAGVAVGIALVVVLWKRPRGPEQP